MAEKSTWGKSKEALQAIGSMKDFREVMRGFWGVFVWAAICDGFSSIPYVGLIFSGLGYGSIWLYLEMNGVSASLFSSTKRMTSFAAEWIAGALGLSVVPGISVWTYFCIEEHKAKQTTNQGKKQENKEREINKSEEGNKIKGRIGTERSAYYKKDSGNWEDKKAA